MEEHLNLLRKRSVKTTNLCSFSFSIGSKISICLNNSIIILIWILINNEVRIVFTVMDSLDLALDFDFHFYYFPFFGYLGNPSVSCYFFVPVCSLGFTCHFITGSQHLKFSSDYRVPHQLEMERYRWCSRSPQAVPVYRQ